MRWWRHKRGTTAPLVVSDDAAGEPEFGELVDMIGPPLEDAFAFADAIAAANSAVARARRILEPYAAKARP
jgi:hypothetical protein